jgi:hypothetical protein
LAREVLHPFEGADFQMMSDTTDMDTSQKSRIAEEPGPQDEPLKEEESPLKKKSTPSGEKAPEEETKELLPEDEEPGTFDRVYEHGRQMGF